MLINLRSSMKPLTCNGCYSIIDSAHEQEHVEICMKNSMQTIKIERLEADMAGLSRVNNKLTANMTELKELSVLLTKEEKKKIMKRAQKKIEKEENRQKSGYNKLDNTYYPARDETHWYTSETKYVGEYHTTADNTTYAYPSRD